jgi:hypothetical protein
MSMADPLLPHAGDRSNEIPAAEPGVGAPPAAHEEEPDVLEEAGAAPEREGVDDLEDPPFRTPQPGERLTAEELEERS